MGNDNNNTSETLRKLAAALGASGVGLGAFGAHALKATLAKKPEGSNNWKTAVSYQLLHAVALLSLSLSYRKSEEIHLLIIICGLVMT